MSIIKPAKKEKSSVIYKRIKMTAKLHDDINDYCQWGVIHLDMFTFYAIYLSFRRLFNQLQKARR